MKPETATAYLYVQTRNRCIDYLRHRQVEEQYADFYRIVTEEDTDTFPDEMEERVQRIEKIIEQLTDPTKTILKECYFDNRKYQEVADKFGISISGVKKHIMKALRLLSALEYFVDMYPLVPAHPQRSAVDKAYACTLTQQYLLYK